MRYFTLILLLSHTAVSWISLKKEKLLDVFPPFKELFVYQIFSDLVIALILVLTFIYFEVKKKNKPLFPFILCCLGVGFIGSFSVLLYLIFDKSLFNQDSTNIKVSHESNVNSSLL
jgi:hypothetical protein